MYFGVGIGLLDVFFVGFFDGFFEFGGECFYFDVVLFELFGVCL